MKTLFGQLIVGFACTVACMSCNDIIVNDSSTREAYPVDVEAYPVDVAVTDYTLPDGVIWQNMQRDSVYIINSQQELFQYLSSTMDIPEIDFEHYSLIVVSGANNSGTESISPRLQQTAKDTYALSIHIKPNLLTVIEKWNVAKLVAKMDENAVIELHVELNWDNDTIYPIEIPFEEYSLTETSCKWANSDSKKVFIINNNEELDKFITCSGEDYPAIDFSKKSLLVISDISSSGISHSTAKRLRQLEQKCYELELELRFNDLTVVTPWQIAIIIDKIDATISVNLKISYKS